MWLSKAELVPQASTNSSEVGQQASVCGLSSSWEFLFSVLLLHYWISQLPWAWTWIQLRATCKFDESIYPSGAVWEMGTLAKKDQIETELWVSTWCLICLYLKGDVIDLDTYGQRSKHTANCILYQFMQIKHTHMYKANKAHVLCAFPWRPSLDKRKTALSRAAVQLFSVVKHVSVWQSKLLFQFAVPTDRAFKIWGEASRHCSQCCKRCQQLFSTTVCACVCTSDGSVRTIVCCAEGDRYAAHSDVWQPLRNHGLIDRGLVRSGAFALNKRTLCFVHCEEIFSKNRLLMWQSFMLCSRESNPR